MVCVFVVCVLHYSNFRLGKRFSYAYFIPSRGRYSRKISRARMFSVAMSRACAACGIYWAMYMLSICVLLVDNNYTSMEERRDDTMPAKYSYGTINCRKHDTRCILTFLSPSTVVFFILFNVLVPRRISKNTKTKMVKLKLTTIPPSKYICI